jgi:hypothetical protein
MQKSNYVKCSSGESFMIILVSQGSGHRICSYLLTNDILCGFLVKYFIYRYIERLAPVLPQLSIPSEKLNVDSIQSSLRCVTP